jgi:hypothetical protein
VRNGSVLGIVVATKRGNIIKSGGFSASVMVDYINTSCLVVTHTGTIVSGTITGAKLFSASKDTITFNAGQMIGVSLTGTAPDGSDVGYHSEPDILSASFIATVLVEC